MSLVPDHLQSQFQTLTFIVLKVAKIWAGKAILQSSCEICSVEHRLTEGNYLNINLSLETEGLTSVLSVCTPLWTCSCSNSQINRVIRITYCREVRTESGWSKRLIVLSKGSVSYLPAYTAGDGI